MEGIDTVSLLFAIAGLVLLVIRRVSLFIMDINVEILNNILQKLLMSGDRARAIKLCAAAPLAPYPAVVKALLQESAARSTTDKEWVIHGSLKGAWERAVAAQEPRLRKLGWLAPLGFAFAVAAVLLAKGQPLQINLVLILAALLWFSSYAKRKGFHRKFQRGQDLLLPLVTAYVVDGRTAISAPSTATDESRSR
jgi:hypothetical protein